MGGHLARHGGLELPMLGKFGVRRIGSCQGREPQTDVSLLLDSRFLQGLNVSLCHMLRPILRGNLRLKGCSAFFGVGEG